MNLITSKCQQRKMEHTEVFFPGLILSKRNRRFLKEAVDYTRFYTTVFTFALNLDSTPHEYRSKAVLSYSIQLRCSQFFPCVCSSAAWIWNDSVYTPVDIQGGRGAPFTQGMGFSIPLYVMAGQKDTEPVTPNSADSTLHLQTVMNLGSFHQQPLTSKWKQQHI